ncbi:MAG: hypothetical protein H0W25_16240 [Acidimicrobiia bacterium]|nr:hypothetical protein [Acidimicrobiia bacterium]
MTAAHAAGRGRPLPRAFVAAFAYAVRVCVPPKRAVLLLVPVVGAALFGLLAGVVEEATTEGQFNAVSNGLFGLVLPLASLVVGDAVLGAEVRSGTFALTWLSPASFPTIVLARWLAGWAIAAAALVPAMVTAALIAGLPEAVAPIIVATAFGTAAYIALFVFVGAAVQRAALWSLGIVLLGERLLGTALTGIAQLSPQWLAQMVYADLGPDADELARSGMPTGWGAVVRLVIVTAVCLLLATRRIRNLKLVGAAD